MIWRIGFDKSEAKQAGKEAGKAQSKETSRDSGGGRGAFAGGVIGGLLGNLLASVKQLFDPLSAIAGLLIAALFPLLKPFLILFIKVGLLLFKWLSAAVGGLGGDGAGTTTEINDQGEKVNKAGKGLVSSLFLIGGIIAGVVAALMGAPALLIAGVAILGGLLVSKVGEFFINMLLKFFTWIDETFGTNFIEPLKVYFQGIADVGQGLFDMFKSLLSLDFLGVWEGFKKFSKGAVGIIIGMFMLLFETLKSTFLVSWEILGGIGSWMWDKLKAVFTKSFNALRNLGSIIKDKILSFIPFGGGGGGSSVNDAIITPNGDIIRTNPNDYLIATKTPENLGGGGSGGGSSINVNINGGMITEEVARDIGKILQRELNLGGGF